MWIASDPGCICVFAGTLLPLPTDALPMPTLCLGGRLPDKHGAIIILDLTTAAPAPGGGASAELTAWGEFHNGVAAGMYPIEPVVLAVQHWTSSKNFCRKNK